MYYKQASVDSKLLSTKWHRILIVHKTSGMIEPQTSIINNFITYFVFRMAMKVWQKIHITLTLQGNNKTCFFSISCLQKFRKKSFRFW